jgi:hypothetical protein
VEWCLRDFTGNEINGGSLQVNTGGVSPKRVIVLRYEDLLNGRDKSEAALTARLLKEGEVLDEKHWLLVPDRDAKLPKAVVKRKGVVKNCTATVTLTSPVYARYVYLEAEGMTAPWSDNFFDIPAGESVTVSVKLPDGMNAAELKEKLRVKTLTDVVPKGTTARDKLLRAEMVLRKRNYLTWAVFKFI